MADYISRSAALACIEGYPEKDGSIVSPDELPEYQRIERLPAADVRENRRGSWVGIDDEPHETFECDRCGFVLEGDPSNFCQNCGADMRGGEEDELPLPEPYAEDRDKGEKQDG